MTDPDLVSRLRARAHDLEGLYGTGSTAPLLTEAADALEARSGICKSCGEYSTLLSDLRSDPPAVEAPKPPPAFNGRGEMWRRRCERYEAWFALPPDQRHPGGPEFSEADEPNTRQREDGAVHGPGIAALAKDGPYEHLPTKPAVVTVAPLKEFGCWQVLVDGAVVPELTVYAFSEARAVERAKAAVARKQET